MITSVSNNNIGIEANKIWQQNVICLSTSIFKAWWKKCILTLLLKSIIGTRYYFGVTNMQKSCEWHNKEGGGIYNINFIIVNGDQSEACLISTTLALVCRRSTVRFLVLSFMLFHASCFRILLVFAWYYSIALITHSRILISLAGMEPVVRLLPPFHDAAAHLKSWCVAEHVR